VLKTYQSYKDIQLMADLAKAMKQKLDEEDKEEKKQEPEDDTVLKRKKE